MNSYGLDCVSSLISDRHILTGKHCISKNSDLRVVRGGGEIAYPVKRVFQLKSKASNVAIIELKTPLRLGDGHFTGISPACLPDFNMTGTFTNDANNYLAIYQSQQHEELAKLTGLPIKPQTHLSLTDKNFGCPEQKYPSLYYSIKGTQYVAGIIHPHTSDLCSDGTIQAFAADNLTVYQGFFKTILKGAKTCVPYVKPQK
jgi:hypothetical protein